MDIVNQVLERLEKEREESEKSIVVEKLIDVDCFLQDLIVVDTNDIRLDLLKTETREDYLQQLVRDNVQILCNKLSDCPTEVLDGYTFFKLPDSSFKLPREKPAPTPKPLTKWEIFAKEKGIKKTKKPKKTWDDILQRWVPTYGYKKAAADKEKEWLLEVPQNKHPNTDMFAEKQKVKKERIAKNEYQRLRNIAASRKIKVPKCGVPPPEGIMHPDQLEVAADIARMSTASVGKFQPKLPKENVKKSKQPGEKKKRKILNSAEEKETNLSLVEGITKKKPKLNLERITNKSIHEQEKRRSKEKPEGHKRKKGRRDNSKSTKKRKGTKGSSKRPASHKGKRMGKQGKGGRKRR